MQKILILLFSIVVSCLRGPAKLSDPNIIITERMFSPDSSYVVFGYKYDIGAFGYSEEAYSIVKTKDTLIDKHVIQGTYAPLTPVKWIDNSTLLTKVDPEAFIRMNKEVNTKPFQLGKITIEITATDPTKGQAAIIEHISPSPDHSKLLVAYEYEQVSALNISVIDFDSELPDLGNIYIGMNWTTNVLFGRWIDNKTIQLDINENSHYFKLNRQNIVSIEENTVEYLQKYPGIMCGWYNKELYPSDTTFQNELDKYGKTTQAHIKSIRRMGDTYHTGNYNYYYEYEVGDNKYQSYFRILKSDSDIQIGDSFELIYSERQPLIHKFKNQPLLTRNQ
jgi:hypothetical protein